MSNADRDTVVPVRPRHPAVAPTATDDGRHTSYWAFRTAQLAVRVLPHKVAYALGATGADVVARVAPRRFSGLRANLRHVLPEADDSALDRLVRANLRNLARCWIDVMEMPYRPTAIARRLDLIKDFHHYAAAAARGKGVVVVSLHLGSWESGLAAWNGGGGQLALLGERVRPQRFFDRIVAARASMGVRVIPLDAAAMRAGDTATARRVGAQAMREVLKHLRRGNTIAIALDRDITGGGDLLPFFGAAAPIPIGTVDVAIRAGAAIVPVTLLRVGDRAQGFVFPEVTYDASAPRDAEVRRVAAEILRLFEPIIREHPDMWHVLEPIWPT